jgi:Fic family protein
MELIIQKRLEPESHIVAWEYATIMNDQFKVIEDIYNGIKNQNITLNLNLIFEMHKVFTETACFTETSLFGSRIKVLIRRGKFKNIPNFPMRSDGLWHEYCPVSKVPEEMNKLISMYHFFKSQNVSPIVLAAWLHLSFIQIHPFQDGNGRVARSLASIVLIENGLFPMVVTLKDKSNYIRALDLANTK